MTKLLVLNQEKIDHIRNVIGKGLTIGLGKPKPGHMCVEAAICYSLGLPHSDKPNCVSPSLRQFKITLNDSSYWTDNLARAKGLERLAITQLGTNIWTAKEEKFFLEELICLSIGWTKKVFKETKENKVWYSWANEYLNNKNRQDKAAADAAVDAAARAAAYAAARAAAYAAADAAAYAAAAAAAAAGAATAAVKGNDFLASCAEDVVQLLIRMKTQGSTWL